jgi:hypothetical protein
MNSVNKILDNNKKSIQKLKKFHDSINLTNLVKKEFPQETGGFHFQIKAEIKRLSKPCNRILDLRNKLKNEDCEEVEFGNIRHYLNESGLNIFKVLTSEYQGAYTFGVYEGVIDRIKELQQKEIKEINILIEKIDKKEEEDKKSLSVVKFSNYHARKEERMHFAVNVKIYNKTEDSIEENIKKIKASYNRNEPIEHNVGLTTNISFSGAGIKVINKFHFEKGQIIIIRLTGMEEDFVITQPFIEYEIMLVERKGKFKYISLRKVDNELNKEIDLYIKNLINSHKRRYKVSLDNVIESAYSKGHEQYYISRLNCIPIYFELHNDKLLSKYAFLNDVNTESFNYFKDKSQDNIFEQVISHSKLKSHIDLNKINNICYLATFFFEKEGKKHFYCLSSKDCGENDFQKFIHCGSKTKTLKIYKSDFIPINAVQDCFVPSALPKEVLQSVMPHELRLSPKIEKILQKVNLIGIFTEVTQNFDLKLYENLKLDKNDIKMLQYCQIKAYSEPVIEYIKAEKNDFRAEDRFLINTSVSIHNGTNIIQGFTSDLSSEGFRARLNNSSNLKKDDKIILTFDDYVDSASFNVRNLEYKIIYKQNDVVACKIIGDVKKHNGAIFWKKYIYTNYYKLRTTGNSHEILGFSKALRNIFTKNHNNLPCFFELKNKQVNPFLLSLSHNLFKRFEMFDNLKIKEKDIIETIKPLFFNFNFIGKLEENYSIINKDNPYVSLKYFVNVKTMASGKPFFKVFFEDQLGCNKEIRDFLNPKDNSKTFVFEVQTTKKSRVFNKYFKNEISYIESYAGYKAEEVLDELKRIAGIIELKDITNIVKSQYILI